MIKQNHRQIISFIDEFISQKGFSPTVREIADGLSRNYSSVTFQLRSLAISGYIALEPGKQRTIRVVKHPEQEAV